MKLKRNPKKCISVFIALLCVLCALGGAVMPCKAEEVVTFVGTEEEREEFEHLLFSKLVYDYLDDYSGCLVEEYVTAYPDRYDKEIWDGGGITYAALYNSLIGDWEIYQVYNHNADTGLYAVAFRREDRVILAFRGSEMPLDEFALDSSNDWMGTDFKFVLFNELSGQFEDADAVYEGLCLKLRADKIPARLTLAGHSLGGALVTYESLVTGTYGYSFDGACGHVIDLIYYDRFLNVEDFSGVDRIRFCNYTDEKGCVGGDLIQHTKADTLFQVDRKTDLTNLREAAYIPKVVDAGSHVVWSCVGHEGNNVFFLERVEPDADGFTYAPDKPCVYDIKRNVLKAAVDSFGEGFTWSSQSLSEIDYGYMLGALTGAVKDGRVMLGTSEADTLFAYDDAGITNTFSLSVVLYGGDGDDFLVGGTADDVFIGGAGNDILEGNLGDDTYVIDKHPESVTVIRDLGGHNSIVFRNRQLRKLENLRWNEEGDLVFSDGQTIRIEGGRENLDFFAYDKGRLRWLGNSGAQTETNAQSFRLLLLDGKGEVTLNAEDGSEEPLCLSNGEPTSENGAFSVTDTPYGRAYINSKEGHESTLLVLWEPCEIRVTSGEKRVNLALGEYIDGQGLTAGDRKYARKFQNYEVKFSSLNPVDGESDISWGDALYSGISAIWNLLK